LMFLQRLLHPLGALEPDQLYLAGVIIQLSSKTALSAFTLFGDVDELTHQLDELRALVDIFNSCDLSAIEITIWVVVEEVFVGGYFQLLTQQLAALGTDAFEEFDRSV